jgi:hypothetical protein
MVHPNFCLTEVRPAEVRVAEVRPTKFRPEEDGPAQVRPVEVRAAEVSPGEVRPAQVRAAEVRVVEIGSDDQTRRSQIRVFYPLIPCRNAFLQPFYVFVICHGTSDRF